MSNFEFKSYRLDPETKTASFVYVNNGVEFVERVSFKITDYQYDKDVLDRAMRLAFGVIGTSYYKTFPSVEVDLGCLKIDDWQATFFDKVYQEGMGQFAYTNNMTREQLAHFVANTSDSSHIAMGEYKGSGILSMQSGGKDSLLTASLLDEKGVVFTSWFMCYGTDFHPQLLESVGSELAVGVRYIDKDALTKAGEMGAKNGHVPVTYMMYSLALIQAILLGKDRIIASIAHEGEEPEHMIGDMAVTHQWSKTWTAEQAIAQYVNKYVSPDIKIGSPLRSISELKVAELFTKHAWGKYGLKFSSCNIANYRQGNDNTQLRWCGKCPKCANTYMLLAPFLPAHELQPLFNGVDLFSDPDQLDNFKGILGVGVDKPFECIAEIDELRKAYEMAMAKGDYQPLPFEVPESNFNYEKTYPSQGWARELIGL